MSLNQLFQIALQPEPQNSTKFKLEQQKKFNAGVEERASKVFDHYKSLIGKKLAAKKRQEYLNRNISISLDNF